MLSSIWVVDLYWPLLSDYRYHLIMVLTIKEKVYINVKEKEQKEQELGKITLGKKKNSWLGSKQLKMEIYSLESSLWKLNKPRRFFPMAKVKLFLSYVPKTHTNIISGAQYLSYRLKCLLCIILFSFEVQTIYWSTYSSQLLAQCSI